MPEVASPANNRSTVGNPGTKVSVALQHHHRENEELDSAYSKQWLVCVTLERTCPPKRDALSKLHSTLAKIGDA